MQTTAMDILRHCEVKANLYKNIFLAENGISLRKYAEVKNFSDLNEMLAHVKREIAENNDSIINTSDIILIKYAPIAIMTDWDGLLKTSDGKMSQGIVDQKEISDFLDNPTKFIVRPRKFIRVIVRSSILHYSDYGHLKYNLYDEGDSLIKDVWYNCLFANNGMQPPAEDCEYTNTTICDGGIPELRTPEAFHYVDN